ncbi:HAD family hydrolase [Trichlorobacter ammonificans]|uniref:phosphoglycolate phosphatase n=1 Tax=Trichlorobacter ammonificans TaxID=2916410 RepID=A0ABN8HMA7_9BACT|nr:HAD family hydrolase [Trichlorobacter ammonificans]CAH2032300.1 Haloacid dehalogenase domain protein hydrolase [Trichlorobacter ammonificans]
MNGRERDIRAVVFDLDGTLYVSEAFEHAVWESVSRYAGHLLDCPAVLGGQRLREVRERLTAERGMVQTLAVAIQALGGTVREMHRRFAAELEPAAMLVPDPRVPRLLHLLARSRRCWLLTNNNRVLTDKILAVLGLQEVFEQVVTIDDTWRPKPDESVLDELLGRLALPPEAVLFVGDRFDIDLRLPEQRGCPVLLTKTIDDLMALERLFDTPETVKQC